jgi:phospholipid-binding lipoprotein MlaA
MKTSRGPRRALIAGLALLTLAACATPPTDPAARAEFEKTNDPLEPMNRKVFEFNLAVDDAVAKPIAKAYRDVVPKFFRTGIRNLIDNFNAPVTFINDLLQGEVERAAETGTRFWVNSLFGFGGFFDVAGQYGLKAHKEDFGQTLAVWGVGEGPYLMVPLMGPSNPRDLGGKVVDNFMNPLSYALASGGVGWIESIAGVIEVIDNREKLLEPSEELRKSSLDYYSSVRSLYRQNREAEIANGKVKRIPLPGEDE